MYYYTLTLAGIKQTCAFRYAETARYFGPYTAPASPSPAALTVPPEDWAFWPNTGKPVDAFAEYSMFSTAASTGLLASGRCIMHAVAFLRRGRAWLIAGAPGVGKSTQIWNLREMHPDEFSVISGDRPVLESMENGSVMVHPSPWNGKENWYGAPAAPLAGVILLRRGEGNSIAPCSVRAAALPLFLYLFQSGENAEILQRAADMATAVLESAPVWTMTTHRVPDSTELLYRTLFAEEAKKDDL